jgi:arylsulfatase A-like enzyme
VKTRASVLSAWAAGIALVAILAGCAGVPPKIYPERRPNILLLISDDQSWLHTGVAGDSTVKTPSIDRLAREGVYFTHAFAAAASCSPSRAALLTGQQIWRLGPAANQSGPLDVEHTVYPDLLGVSGYFVGYTGVGWKPGDVKATGRSGNPAGNEFNMFGDRNPVANFEAFLDSIPGDAPFCFWWGSRFPHRPFSPARDIPSTLDKIAVPPVWPDIERVRHDLAEYLRDVERFDQEVGAAIETLAARGFLENTLIVVTSDNGMPFPRAKANLYDLGTRVPLVIYWKGRAPGGRVVDDLVSLTDLAPTFLEAAGIKPTSRMTGSSLMNILKSMASGRVDSKREFAVTARERHAVSRSDLSGYPARAIRTREYLYIRNYEPGRWPAGDPPVYGDVDSWNSTYAAPTKDYMIAVCDDPVVRPFFDLCFEKRPAEELYDVRKDPYETVNLLAPRGAGNSGSHDEEASELEKIRKRLSEMLDEYLEKTGDPRATGDPAPWDSYPAVGRFPFPKATEEPDSSS